MTILKCFLEMFVQKRVQTIHNNYEGFLFESCLYMGMIHNQCKLNVKKLTRRSDSQAHCGWGGKIEIIIMIVFVILYLLTKVNFGTMQLLAELLNVIIWFSV